MLSIIVAKSRNNVIGKDNKLIWHLPADLKRFKELTINHTIIMGRRTFESLGRILPNRKHIIFSRNSNYKVDNDNVKIVSSIEEMNEYIQNDEENFVIGGAMIYNLLMPYATKLYITQINEDYEGDTFFPTINNNIWQEKDRKKGIRDEKNDLDYEYIVYEKCN